MSLRNRLRAPLISAVTAALIGGLLVSRRPPRAQPPIPTASPTARPSCSPQEAAAKKDGLTQSRAVFARSSYLCIGYTACGKAGMGAAGYSQANDKMYWRMYAGHNCTNYAAYRMVNSGLPNTRPWSGGGNATYWGTSVPTITDKVPAVGAVAWWRANTGPAGSAGHVAYVEKVVSADEIIISQDSWGGDFSWAVVTKASGNWPSGFIHFNDMKLVNKAAPVVSGLAKVGASLTATTGTWNPTDAKIAYQWFANGVAIPSATKSTLVVDSLRLGQTIQVRTTASKVGYPTKTALSAATAAVLPGLLASTTPPAVSGVAKVERTLSLSQGAWNVAPDSTTVQWYADGQPIAGAVGGTLRLTPELAGRAISASVTATRSGYDPLTVTTPASVPVALGTIKVRRQPAVSGTAKPTAVLTVDPGAYHLGDATVAIQWLRGGQPVPNATGTTYRVSPADLGSLVSASVTVSRAGYETITMTSPSTRRVRVTPHFKVLRAQRKHAVRLRIAVSARFIPAVTGKVVVRVAGRLPAGPGAPARRRPRRRDRRAEGQARDQDRLHGQPDHRASAPGSARSGSPDRSRHRLVAAGVLRLDRGAVGVRRRGVPLARVQRLGDDRLHPRIVGVAGEEPVGGHERHRLHRALLDLQRQVDERGHQLAGYVGAQDLLARRGERLVAAQHRHRVGRLDERVDHAPLAEHPLVVVGAPPTAGVPERVEAVEVLVRPGLEVAGRRDAGVGVAVDRDRLVDVDRDAADRVDQLPEARAG